MSPARRASAAADRLGVTKREQRIADLQEIERVQRTEEAIVVATQRLRELGFRYRSCLRQFLGS
jgi:hypothetical protein